MQSSVAPLMTSTEQGRRMSVPGSLDDPQDDHEQAEPSREPQTSESIHGDEAGAPSSTPADQILDMVLIKLADMGFKAPPSSQSFKAPSSPREPIDVRHDPPSSSSERWERRPWKGWSEGWSSHEEWNPDTGADWKTGDTGADWKTGDTGADWKTEATAEHWRSGNWKDSRWKSEDTRHDRPYISHLIFQGLMAGVNNFPSTSMR